MVLKQLQQAACLPALITPPRHSQQAIGLFELPRLSRLTNRHEDGGRNFQTLQFLLRSLLSFDFPLSECVACHTNTCDFCFLYVVHTSCAPAPLLMPICITICATIRWKPCLLLIRFRNHIFYCLLWRKSSVGIEAFLVLTATTRLDSKTSSLRTFLLA